MLQQEEANHPAYTKLTFSKPEGLTAEGEQAYQYALAFVQKASLYLCPRCADWCEPWNTNNKLLEKPCMLSHIAGILLTDIQTEYTQK